MEKKKTVDSFDGLSTRFSPIAIDLHLNAETIVFATPASKLRHAIEAVHGPVDSILWTWSGKSGESALKVGTSVMSESMPLLFMSESSVVTYSRSSFDDLPTADKAEIQRRLGKAPVGELSSAPDYMVFRTTSIKGRQNDKSAVLGVFFYGSPSVIPSESKLFIYAPSRTGASIRKYRASSPGYREFPIGNVSWDGYIGVIANDRFLARHFDDETKRWKVTVSSMQTGQEVRSFIPITLPDVLMRVSTE